MQVGIKKTEPSQTERNCLVSLMVCVLVPCALGLDDCVRYLHGNSLTRDDREMRTYIMFV